MQGLSAKEDLDILCVVDKLPSSLLLQSQGFIFKGELNIPLRYYFSKNTALSKVNLHVVEADHAFISLNLGFRDYLRTHDDMRIAYAKLKEELTSDPENFKRVSGIFSGYGLGKDAFIKNVLRAMGFNEYVLNFCVHYQEWAAYHRIHEEQIFAPLQREYDRTHPSLSAENHYHLVLYKGTTIVAAAHLEFLSRDEVLLHTIAIDTGYQKQGLGTVMMRDIERWIKNHGCARIHVKAPSFVAAFFRKRGYVDNLDEDTTLGGYGNLFKKL